MWEVKGPFFINDAVKAKFISDLGEKVKGYELSQKEMKNGRKWLVRRYDPNDKVTLN